MVLSISLFSTCIFFGLFDCQAFVMKKEKSHRLICLIIRKCISHIVNDVDLLCKKVSVYIVLQISQVGNEWNWVFYFSSVSCVVCGLLLWWVKPRNWVLICYIWFLFFRISCGLLDRLSQCFDAFLWRKIIWIPLCMVISLASSFTFLVLTCEQRFWFEPH